MHDYSDDAFMISDGNIFINECACVARVYSDTCKTCTDINDVNRGMSANTDIR